MNNEYRPLVPVNPQGLDDVALALLNEPAKGDKDKGDQPPSPSVIPNREQYIILPTKNHGKYSYPDMLVAMDLTHLGKTWYDTHKLLAAEGDKMLTIRQFVDFVNLIKTGRAFNGAGRPVDKRRLDTILDNITAVRDPYRAEWLDADFKVLDKKFGLFGGKVAMNYGHTMVNGVLTPTKRDEVLEGYLAEDKKPGIDMNDWLARATYQGLPPADVKNGNLWYWQPGKDNNSVARFGASSGWAYLSCDRNPTNSNSSLGVRAAREKI